MRRGKEKNRLVLLLLAKQRLWHRELHWILLAIGIACWVPVLAVLAFVFDWWLRSRGSSLNLGPSTLDVFGIIASSCFFIAALAGILISFAAVKSMRIDEETTIAFSSQEIYMAFRDAARITAWQYLWVFFLLPVGIAALITLYPWSFIVTIEVITLLVKLLGFALAAMAAIQFTVLKLSRHHSAIQLGVVLAFLIPIGLLVNFDHMLAPFWMPYSLTNTISALVLLCIGKVLLTATSKTPAEFGLEFTTRRW